MSRNPERGTVVVQQRLLPVRAPSDDGSTSRSRVDASEVDVSVDEAEDEAENAEH